MESPDSVPVMQVPMQMMALEKNSSSTQNENGPPGHKRLVGILVRANEEDSRGIRHDDSELGTDDHACLPLCSFAHACEGRSPQAGTPEIANVTQARPCGIRHMAGLDTHRAGFCWVTGRDSGSRMNWRGHHRLLPG
uniref:Uncharacterized protein n=1 Tax=Ananas comosus var. bracteatus TaxID=296719 RepID=A0A6V7PXJ8_ANACO|nr:unnamed protein product [Ananas comosus var. bracteatus]